MAHHHRPAGGESFTSVTSFYFFSSPSPSSPHAHVSSAEADLSTPRPPYLTEIHSAREILPVPAREPSLPSSAVSLRPTYLTISSPHPPPHPEVHLYLLAQPGPANPRGARAPENSRPALTRAPAAVHGPEPRPGRAGARWGRWGRGCRRRRGFQEGGTIE